MLSSDHTLSVTVPSSPFDVASVTSVVVLLSAAFPHPDNKPTPIVNISKVEIHFLLIQILPFLILYSTIVPYPLSCRKSQIQHKFSQIQLLILHKINPIIDIIFIPIMGFITILCNFVALLGFTYCFSDCQNAAW